MYEFNIPIVDLDVMLTGNLLANIGPRNALIDYYKIDIKNKVLEYSKTFVDFCMYGLSTSSNKNRFLMPRGH